MMFGDAELLFAGWVLTQMFGNKGGAPPAPPKKDEPPAPPKKDEPPAPPPKPPPPAPPVGVTYPEHKPALPGDHWCSYCDPLADFAWVDSNLQRVAAPRDANEEKALLLAGGMKITAADVDDDDPRSPNYNPASASAASTLLPEITPRMLPPEDVRSQWKPAPPPMPVKPPATLPPWPGGWQPYPNPIPPEVVARANSLLPELQIPQTRAELVGAEWVTFQAQYRPAQVIAQQQIPAGKNIVAWKQKPAQGGGLIMSSASPASSQQQTISNIMRGGLSLVR